AEVNAVHGVHVPGDAREDAAAIRVVDFEPLDLEQGAGHAAGIAWAGIAWSQHAAALLPAGRNAGARSRQTGMACPQRGANRQAPPHSEGGGTRPAITASLRSRRMPGRGIERSRAWVYGCCGWCRTDRTGPD